VGRSAHGSTVIPTLGSAVDVGSGTVEVVGSGTAVTVTCGSGSDDVPVPETESRPPESSVLPELPVPRLTDPLSPVSGPPPEVPVPSDCVPEVPESSAVARSRSTRAPLPTGTACV
jgi:hypothetical protein